MRLILACLLLAAAGGTWPASANDALAESVAQLRHVVGTWDVTTEFLDENGSVNRSVSGTYCFRWVVEDRVLMGESDLTSLGRTALLFYVNETAGIIEMVSVSHDGRLWVMNGPLGEETRYTQEFETSDGGMGRLRFTRFNVSPDRFESRMEYTNDGGETWRPGNHQVFVRQSSGGS